MLVKVGDKIEPIDKKCVLMRRPLDLGQRRGGPAKCGHTSQNHGGANPM
jgi:hypothetical protein